MTALDDDSPIDEHDLVRDLARERELETDLAFFAEATSVNARNVIRDARVALSITNPDQPLDMAAVRGEVIERVDGERGQAIVDRIARKYSDEPYAEGNLAFIVRPRTWTARDYS